MGLDNEILSNKVAKYDNNLDIVRKIIESSSNTAQCKRSLEKIGIKSDKIIQNFTTKSPSSISGDLINKIVTFKTMINQIGIKCKNISEIEQKSGKITDCLDYFYISCQPNNFSSVIEKTNNMKIQIKQLSKIVNIGKISEEILIKRVGKIQPNPISLPPIKKDEKNNEIIELQEAYYNLISIKRTVEKSLTEKQYQLLVEEEKSEKTAKQLALILILRLTNKLLRKETEKVKKNREELEKLIGKVREENMKEELWKLLEMEKLQYVSLDKKELKSTREKIKLIKLKQIKNAYKKIFSQQEEKLLKEKKENIEDQVFSAFNQITDKRMAKQVEEETKKKETTKGKKALLVEEIKIEKEKRKREIMEKTEEKIMSRQQPQVQIKEERKKKKHQ